jgi:hypothetical protein
MTTHERKINATKGIQGFHETPKTEPQNTALVAAEPDPYAGFSRQSAGPIKGLSLQVSARSARELSRMVEDESLMLDPPYQRGDVWSMDQRVNLVKSWISQTPIPAVIYNCRDRLTWKGEAPEASGRGFYAVVDGRQRLETARAWFNGEFGAPASWFDPEHVEEAFETSDGPYVKYDGLSVIGQRLMSNRALLPVAEASLGTVEEEAELYLRLNAAGTPQTDDDMHNARLVAGR